MTTRMILTVEFHFLMEFGIQIRKARSLVSLGGRNRQAASSNHVEWHGICHKAAQSVVDIQIKLSEIFFTSERTLRNLTIKFLKGDKDNR